MRFLIPSLALLILLVPSLTCADELKLTSVIRSVKEQHPLLLATAEELSSAEGELLAARGAFDPSIKLEASTRGTGYYEGTRLGGFVEQPLEFYGSRIFAGYRRSEGRIPVYEGMFETLEGGEFNTGFEVPLFRDGPIDRRRASIQRFSLQSDIANASIEERLIALTRAATVAFWDWAAAGERVRVFKELLSVAEERNAQLSTRVKHGDIPEFDLTDNERQVFQRKAQLVQAERNLQNSAFELSLYLRDLEGNQIFPAPTSLPTRVAKLPQLPNTDESTLIEEAFKRRPDLTKIARLKDQNSIERTLQENQMQPRVDLQVMASQDSGSGSPTLEEGELKAGLKVELPLRVRTAEGRVQVTDAKDRELSRLLQFQKQKIATDVKDAINALRLIQERFLFARKEITAARNLEKGERERFLLGDSNLIFVNLREQTAAEASIREIEAFQEYQKAYAAYRAVMAYDHDEIIRQVQ